MVFLLLSFASTLTIICFWTASMPVICRSNNCLICLQLSRWDYTGRSNASVLWRTTKSDPAGCTFIANDLFISVFTTGASSTNAVSIYAVSITTAGSLTPCSCSGVGTSVTDSVDVSGTAETGCTSTGASMTTSTTSEGFTVSITIGSFSTTYGVSDTYATSIKGVVPVDADTVYCGVYWNFSN